MLASQSDTPGRMAMNGDFAPPSHTNVANSMAALYCGRIRQPCHGKSGFAHQADAAIFPTSAPLHARRAGKILSLRSLRVRH